MKHVSLTLGAIAGLVMSANAAAFDESRDDLVAPGLHLSVSFGGSSPPQLTRPAFHDPSITLHETGGSADNTRMLIVIGAIAVAAIVVVAATHHDNGRGNGY